MKFDRQCSRRLPSITKAVKLHQIFVHIRSRYVRSQLHKIIMPSISISIADQSAEPISSSPLPQLLHTPHGLAIIEIQGTLNMPDAKSGTNTDTGESKLIGQLVFPNIGKADSDGSEEGAWMKKVYFYVGKNQRLVGEVRKLPKPFGVLQKKEPRSQREQEEAKDTRTEELEIVDVVRWKIFFGARPEFV